MQISWEIFQSNQSMEKCVTINSYFSAKTVKWGQEKFLLWQKTNLVRQLSTLFLYKRSIQMLFIWIILFDSSIRPVLLLKIGTSRTENLIQAPPVDVGETVQSVYPNANFLIPQPILMVPPFIRIVSKRRFEWMSHQRVWEIIVKIIVEIQF